MLQFGFGKLGDRPEKRHQIAQRNTECQQLARLAEDRGVAHAGGDGLRTHIGIEDAAKVYIEKLLGTHTVYAFHRTERTEGCGERFVLGRVEGVGFRLLRPENGVPIGVKDFVLVTDNDKARFVLASGIVLQTDEGCQMLLRRRYGGIVRAQRHDVQAVVHRLFHPYDAKRTDKGLDVVVKVLARIAHVRIVFPVEIDGEENARHGRLVMPHAVGKTFYVPAHAGKGFLEAFPLVGVALGTDFENRFVTIGVV